MIRLEGKDILIFFGVIFIIIILIFLLMQSRAKGRIRKSTNTGKKHTEVDDESLKYEKYTKHITKTEKAYFDILWKRYKDDYDLETQVYLRSMFPGMHAENLIIDIVFKNKKNHKPVLLLEINDETHNKNKIRRMRDVELKEFCSKNNIKLQALWTRYGINEKSIYNLIDKKLLE